MSYQMDWASPTAGGPLQGSHTANFFFAFDNVAVAPGMVGDIPEDQARAQRMADAAALAHTRMLFCRNRNCLVDQRSGRSSSP